MQPASREKIRRENDSGHKVAGFGFALDQSRKYSIWFRLTPLCDWSRNSRHPLNQSNGNSKQSQLGLLRQLRQLRLTVLCDWSIKLAPRSQSIRRKLTQVSLGRLRLSALQWVCFFCVLTGSFCLCCDWSRHSIKKSWRLVLFFFPSILD